MKYNNILPSGTGMPFVTIADSNNKDIIDTVSNKPIGQLVTSFYYNYREEEDDKCEIVITCDNPDLLDLPQFREQNYLLVQWGYITNTQKMIPSPVRKVMVRDTKLRLSDSGCIITIIGTDGLSILKTASNNKKKDQNFLDWVKDTLSHNYKFRYLVNDVKEVSPVKEQSYWVQTSLTGGVNFNYIKPKEEGLKDTVADNLLKTRIFIGTGKTPYNLLKDSVKTIPNGPYHLDGRDDTISIHPTNFNQSPIATFKYKGEGGFISLTIETRKKSKGLDVVQNSRIDGKTKNINNQITQTDGNKKELGVDGITGESIPISKYSNTETTKKGLEKNPEILKQNASKYLEDVVNKYKEAGDDPVALSNINLETYRVPIKVKVKETINPSDYGTDYYGLLGPRDINKQTTGWEKIKKDKDIIIVPKPDGKKYQWDENPEVIMDKEITLELSGIDLLGYVTDDDTNKILAFNKVNDSLQKQVEATLTVIGQPFIESSKIITLEGISKKYSGDWYIKEINHKIDAGLGYICLMELIKKTSSNGSLVQSKVKVNTPSLASKLQKIAKEQSDPVEIAKRNEIISSQEKILNDFKDAGSVIIATDEEGYPVMVKADSDWVSINKQTQTEEINKNDQILRDKTK